MDHVEIIYKPVGPVKVDIFFIHGLGADWKQTWNLSSFLPWYSGEGKSNIPLSPLSDSWTVDDSKSVPRFPGCSNLQHARLLAWGSNEIDPVTFTYEQLGKLARSLFTAIRQSREQVMFDDEQEENLLTSLWDDRRVIFVAHSIGGLILKKALVQIQTEQVSFLRSISGVVLFAVPFFQSKKDWAKFLYLLRRKNNRPSKRHRFAVLPKLDRAFAALISMHKIPLCCVYEEKPVYRRGILVCEDHALPVLEKAHTSLLISIAAPTDHFNITRLDPHGNPDYYFKVVEQLDIMASGTTNHDERRPQSSLFKTEAPIKTRTPSTRFTYENPNEILELLQDHIEERELVVYASNLYEEGKYREAQSAYHAALGGLEATSNTNSLVSLYCKDRLANALFELGEYQSAVELCTHIKKIKEDTWPPDYVSMLKTTRTYVMILRTRQEFHLPGKSIAQLLECNDGLRPGSYEHIETLNVLAKVLKDQNCCEFAEFLLREVIEAATRLLGEKNPYTLARLSELSSMLWLRGHYSQAEEVSWYAYGALETCLGIYHPAVFSAAERCAKYLRARRRLEQSSDILCAILPRMKVMLGKNHPATLRTKSGIAANHILEGRIAEGSDLLYEIDRKQSADHRDKIWTSQAIKLLQEWLGKDRKTYPEWLDCNDVPPKFENFLRQPIKPVNRNITDYFYGERTPKLFLPEPSLPSEACLVRHKVFYGEHVDEADLRNPTIITSAGDYYGTVLHAAAFRGNLSLVKMFVDAGAEVDRKCGVFITPIKAAIIGGHPDVVRYLLDKSKGHEAGPFLTNLEVAIHFERVTIVEILLTQENAKYVSPQFGSSLNQAIPTARVEIVKLLLDKAGIDHARAGLASRSSFIEEAASAAGDASAQGAQSGYGSISSFERVKNTLIVLNMLIGETKKSENMQYKDEILLFAKRRTLGNPSFAPFLDRREPFELVHRASIQPVKPFFPHFESPMVKINEAPKTRSWRRSLRIGSIKAR